MTDRRWPPSPAASARPTTAAHDLDEFIEADFQEGWLYELARGVVEVTEVPGPHGTDRRSSRPAVHPLRRSTSRRHQLPGRRRRMPSAAGHALGSPPDQAIYLDPEPARTLGRDGSRTSSSRSSAQAERRRDFVDEARGIPPDRRARILDPRPEQAAAARLCSVAGDIWEEIVVHPDGLPDAPPPRPGSPPRRTARPRRG